MKMRPMIAIAACLSIGALAGCAGPTAAPGLPVSPVVRIDTGQVQGSVIDGVQSFRGIPYVAPPVGELRWRRPQPAASWEGVRQATAYSPFCPQLGSKFTSFELTRMSEDCLTLNVLTTAANSDARLPVMVWVHGGGYVTGSGNTLQLNSTALPKKDVVLVTINYRLGLFGFMTHPALASADPGETQGNYGLLDVVAALQWVQRNIAAFGGNPGNITIFGESAGAGIVNSLLVMPDAGGLFHRAISESSSVGIAPDPYIDRRAGFLPPSNTAGIAFAKRLGVQRYEDSAPEVAAALRAISMEDIMAAMIPVDRFTPVIDGVVMPDQVGTLTAAGKQHKVPYLTGGNTWEASLGRAIGGGFSPEVAGKLVPAAEKARLYPGLSGDTLDDTIFGDLVVLSASRYFAEQMARAGTPVYRYYLSYVAEARRDKQPGAGHTDDIAFVMQTLDHERDLDVISARDREISELMSSYWVQFARTGNPNRSGLPPWPAFDLEKGGTLEIGEKTSILEFPLEERMQFHISRGLGLLEKARTSQ